MVAFPNIVYVLTFLVGFASCLQFYYSKGVTKTWADAKLDCEGRGMELAVLDTPEKYQDAMNYMSAQTGNNILNDVYTGISLDRSKSYPPYVYIYTTGVVAPYLPWTSGEPNYQDTDFCVRMKLPDLLLATIVCSNLYDYLCTEKVLTSTLSSTKSVTLQQTTETFYQNNDSTSKKRFPGTIFVSGAVIGMAIGAASLCVGICLLCVFCRFCRRKNDDNEKLKPEPTKTNSVLPRTIAQFEVPQVKPQYIP